jgi:DNA-binding response OmpR family regulator
MDKTSAHTSLAPCRTRRVLVLARREETLARTTDILERAGFLALCQTSPAGAADFAVREGVDAVVVDFDSQVRSECVARVLREHASLSTLPIVLMSSEPSQRVEDAATDGTAKGALGQAGGETTLAKALMPLALVPLLRSLIEHRVQSDAWERR